MSVRSPPSWSNCFGRRLRLSGHRRVPSPPARMAIWVSAGTRRAALLSAITEERVGPGQSIVQRRRGVPTEVTARPCWVEDDAHHIALAGRTIGWLTVVSGDFRHRVEDLTD